MKKERIEDYAKRLIAQITDEKPILIGISFGGMIACEIAKQIETQKVILIASAPTKNEIPVYYRLAGMIYFPKFLPFKVLKKANNMTYWFLGTETKQEKRILKEILEDTQEEFLQWAIGKIVNWKNISQPKNLVLIHGTKDRILPIRCAKFDYRIENGGHFMTINKHLEISKIILNELLK